MSALNFLTRKEEIVLETIQNYFNKKKAMPSIRQLLPAVNSHGLPVKSVGSIFTYLNALEKKGFITRDRNRTIHLVDKQSKQFVFIPILGTANAGSPTFFAEENIQGTLRVSKRLIHDESIFAIKVSGTSMNKSHINGKKVENGDFVLVNPDYSDYRDGDKVLVVIDGLATIKTFKKVGKETIGLFPESTDTVHQPIYLTPEDNFVMNGRIIDVFKSFSPAMA